MSARSSVRLLCCLLIQGALRASLGSKRGKVAFVTLATDDYFAMGALVTLHSIGLHTDSTEVDRLLLVPGNHLSSTWLNIFEKLGVSLILVSEVPPSAVLLEAMELDRKKLENQGVLHVLQPVPYGGAFAKIHAWDPNIFGKYSKVILLDGDVLAKRPLGPLLKMKPLAAGRDLNDAFNYGVLVLKPDATIHADLLRLLTGTTTEDLRSYNRRKATETGLCDQTLVSGYLTKKHGGINFFEDARSASRSDPSGWVMSTEFNMLVSYRTKERCESPEERGRVDAARLIHFSNNWLHFGALARNRSAPGRIDAPRCYAAAFRYWHDVYHHAMALASGAGNPEVPVYKPMAKDETGDASGEEVFAVFQDFEKLRTKGGGADLLTVKIEL